ncbi:hypothetical protein ACP2W0_09980 [Pseudobacillus badius]|uniref:hypothetical protein n=1 Tax=Bacillus badius TaxID=1455 RepID=UPI003CF76FC2
MSEHKGAITLLIATLLLFSLWVIFGTDVIDPLLKNIGAKFTSMVNMIRTPMLGSGMIDLMNGFAFAIPKIRKECSCFE